MRVISTSSRQKQRFMNIQIINRLTSCGFKVDNRGQIFKTSARNKTKEKAGVLNDYSVYFYAQNVAPFKAGTNTFKEILGNNYVYTEYKPEPKKSEKTHDFTFSDYKETTKERNDFQLFIKQYTSANPYDIRGVKSGYLENATLFPYIDYFNNFQTAKIVKYNSKTGKRIKADFSNSWFHAYKPIKKELGLNDKITKKITCFFGEHLVANNNKPIVIVEAEKTAIILSLLFKDIVFIASGGLHKLNSLDYSFLANRDVYLYPDNGANEWHLIGKKRGWYVSQIIENKGEQGSDVADYLETEIGDEIANELNAISEGKIKETEQGLNFSVKAKTKNRFCSPVTKELGLNYYWDNAKGIGFKANNFEFFKNDFEVLSANVDFNKWELLDGKFQQINEIVFLERLEKCFRVLKELNPDKNIPKIFIRVLNNLLESSNFLFNRDYILNEFIPLWDNDKNDVCEYVKTRNYRKISNTAIDYKDFLPFLNNDKKIYSTRNLLKKLEPLLNGKYYIKPQQIGLDRSIKNPFIWGLIKEYNTKVIGCNTYNNFSKKLELATWINTNTDYWGYKKMHSTYITDIYCAKSCTPPENKLTIKGLHRDTKIHKTVIREYLSFKPNRDVLSDIKTKVEYYIDFSNNMTFERSNERITILDNISIEQMRETLKGQEKPQYNINQKDAFNYKLDLKDSVLNCSETEAMIKGDVFLTSWILFNNPDLKEIDRLNVKINPFQFLEYQNMCLAS